MRGCTYVRTAYDFCVSKGLSDRTTDISVATAMVNAEESTEIMITCEII